MQPSHEEKRSGEPSQISWAGTLLQLVQNILHHIQLMFRYKSREAKFYFCKNVIISQSHWSLLLSTFWEQAQEIHQTVSCWRVHVGWARE